jgi:hypothetical protein
VAIPTDDRKTVAEHFGRARYFWITEVDEGSVLSEQLLENSDRHHGHGDHQGSVEILKDVDVVMRKRPPRFTSPVCNPLTVLEDKLKKSFMYGPIRLIKE